MRGKISVTEAIDDYKVGGSGLNFGVRVECCLFLIALHGGTITFHHVAAMLYVRPSTLPCDVLLPNIPHGSRETVNSWAESTETERSNRRLETLKVALK